jgi:sugar/nucleoside kinase (ribokinase family)
MDVLLWGTYFFDIIFTGLPRIPRLGTEVFSRDLTITPGGPFNTAVALHRLGINSAWSCDFGTDFFSQFVLERAAMEKLDTSLFTYHNFPVRRITAAFSLTDDRGFMSFMDEVPQTSPIAQMKENNPKFLLLPHLHYGADYEDIFLTAQLHGIRIIMDCQSTEASLETPGVECALKSVDVFIPNEVEAIQLTGASSAEEALTILAKLTPLVIIKCGKDGAISMQGDEVIHEPAIDVQVIDTTGAGDCFNAGFLFGHLVLGVPLSACLKAANFCGGISVTAVGGEAIPNAADVRKHLGL